FFFSSRRRHTRFSRDWSSDVCSSDLTAFSTRGSAMTDAALAKADPAPPVPPAQAAPRKQRTLTADVFRQFRQHRGGVIGACIFQIGRASCRERVQRPGAAAPLEPTRT